MEFYRTHGGRRFIDHTLPDLALQIQRVALSLSRIVDLLEAAAALEPRASETRPASSDGR
jgi:hypothetical protein